MMTKLERAAKEQVMDILAEEGYPTYAKLFNYFDLNLTEDPKVIGYMEPAKARIVINKNLSIDQVSFVVRHEILHEYLDHQMRIEQHVGKDKWDKRTKDMHQTFNIAADYEISNRGYTPKDKITARSIKLNGSVLQGLVTELDHPDWVDLSAEEMYDKLISDPELQKNLDQAQQSAQIGDVGDAEQQEMEDIQRKAQAAAEAAEEQNDSGQAQKAQQVSNAAGQVADAIEKSDKNGDNAGQPLKSAEESEEDAQLAKKVAEIKKAFEEIKKNQGKGNPLEQEVTDKVRGETEEKRKRQEDRFRATPLNKFKLSLIKVIKDQTATGRGPTWTRFNKKYASSGLIRPGSSRLAQGKIPVINVYYDRSGSWDDAKTKVGEQAMATIQEYVRRGLIKMNVFYFSTFVSPDRKEAERGGGTSGQPILNHIEATKPTNVVVMTDSDIGDCSTYVTVPGAVWFLFKDGESENLMDHLRGLKLTQKFDI